MPRSYILFIVVLMGTAACQSALSSATTPTVEPTSTVERTPESTPKNSTTSDWEQVDVKGVRLGIQIPDGWEAQETDDGVLIAEHFGTIESNSAGMMIYLFVHSLDGFQLPASTHANIAWAALEQISKQREYIGDALVSAPAGFDWNGQDAAYYLLNDGDGNLSMLIAVALSAPQRLVVCRFISPASQADKIRAMLPDVLGTLSINGITMDMDALHELPDPLQFPQAESTPER
ncbi:MAG: hypothetical protein ABI690_11380 [Chloroflexota bacterium]